MAFTNEQLERYSRHIILKEVATPCIMQFFPLPLLHQLCSLL